MATEAIDRSLFTDPALVQTIKVFNDSGYLTTTHITEGGRWCAIIGQKDIYPDNNYPRVESVVSLDRTNPFWAAAKLRLLTEPDKVYPYSEYNSYLQKEVKAILARIAVNAEWKQLIGLGLALLDTEAVLNNPSLRKDNSSWPQFDRDRQTFAQRLHADYIEFGRERGERLRNRNKGVFLEKAAAIDRKEWKVILKDYLT